MNFLQKHLLSQKEVKEVQNKIKDMYGVTITSEKIEIGKEKRRVFYFVDGVLSFFLMINLFQLYVSPRNMV